ncbi:MAG: PIN domain-containing protein [Thermoanaerobaculia bacterium]
MKLAYVDTSCLVAIAFAEQGHEALANELLDFDRLFASNLAEAELLSAFARENADGPAGLLSALTWVFPNRPLTQEYREVLAGGYVRGADLFHLACGLFLRRELGDLLFLSVDHRQLAVARSLGM